MYKPICKSVKFMQTYLNDPILYKTDKIQKTFRANKPEFLRLLAIQSQVKEKFLFYFILISFFII